MSNIDENIVRKLVREQLDVILEMKKRLTKAETIEAIKKSRNLPEEYKDIAIKLMKEYSTYYSDGRVTELNLHPDLIKKIKENGWKDGFSMGIDKDGYFIHTHRARSKSHENPTDFTKREVDRTESSG